MAIRRISLCAVLVFCFAAVVVGCGGNTVPDTDIPSDDARIDSLTPDAPAADAIVEDSRPGDLPTTDIPADDVPGNDVPSQDLPVTDLPIADLPVTDTATPGEYTILAWNNLGMHCYNPSFKTLAVLPPYNTLLAQVIKQGPSPQVVTSGITVEYSFPDNTYSAASSPVKSDFWTYAEDLFGVALEPDIGLTGKGLTGTMDIKGDHFEAEGIPITEFRDVDAVPGGGPLTWNRYPYQLATIIVKNSATGVELTRATVVSPVSSELNCQTCHGDSGSATMKYNITPSGEENADLNILRIHDHLSGTNHEDSQPVLCAGCHASNALGTAGVGGIPNLSKAIHSRHADIGITEDTAGCYACHPGPKTKCLRDVMTMDGDVAGCVECHGNMTKVASNPNPWINEPRCDSAECHGNDAVQDQPLYTVSKGHHGVYCAGCHDSPHAIAPARETNDGIKFMELQGDEGPVKECNVCHTTEPGGSIHEDD